MLYHLFNLGPDAVKEPLRVGVPLGGDSEHPAGGPQPQLPPGHLAAGPGHQGVDRAHTHRARLSWPRECGEGIGPREILAKLAQKMPKMKNNKKWYIFCPIFFNFWKFLEELWPFEQ